MTGENEHRDDKEEQWQANQPASAGMPFTGEVAIRNGTPNPATPILVPGMRVELTGTPTAVMLRSRTGRIARPDDDDDDYVIVALDSPADYYHANGEVEELPEIAVMTDNLRVLGF